MQWRIALFVFLLDVGSAATGATLEVTVTGADGKPLEWAVVHVVPDPAQAAAMPPATERMVDQVDREFVPYVTAVRVGTAIAFPNNDNIRHQVYSFSPAKTFELPLYKGNPHRPVRFDAPGIVALGCNIHDWMSAYVFVADSPWFAVSDASGLARIVELPPGQYAVQIWHPRQKTEAAATRQSVSVGEAGASATFAVEEKSLFRPWRAPTGLKTGGY